MKLTTAAGIILSLVLATASAQERITVPGVVYSYLNDGMRQFTSTPPPPGSTEAYAIGSGSIAKEEARKINERMGYMAAEAAAAAKVAEATDARVAEAAASVAAREARAAKNRAEGQRHYDAATERQVELQRQRRIDAPRFARQEALEIQQEELQLERERIAEQQQTEALNRALRQAGADIQEAGRRTQDSAPYPTVPVYVPTVPRPDIIHCRTIGNIEYCN